MEEELKLKDNYALYTFYDNENRKLRTLFSGSSYQSVTYMDELKYELFGNHIKLYKICENHKKDITDILVLGGGGFSYPKHVISHYKDICVDVVEIEPYIIKIAFKYFFLEDLIKEYDPNKDRLQIKTMDAYKYLNDCKKKYDSILIDLFYDSEPLSQTFENKNIKNIIKCMKHDGIVVINYIVKNNYLIDEKLKSNIDMLKTYFSKVKIISNGLFYVEKKGNILIICTNVDKSVNVNIEMFEICI